MIPDHLPAFGISCETQEELSRFCHQVIQHGKTIQIPGEQHRLVRWEASKGIHIWMYVNPANEVESMFPFYYPVSSHVLDVKRFLQETENPGENVLLEGWLLKEDNVSDGVNGGDEPLRSNEHEMNRGVRLCFACVDAPLYVHDLQSANRKSFQLFGICRKPKLHLDREAFQEKQREWGGGMDIQARTVIPSDVLNLEVDPFFRDASVAPYAYVSGVVRTTEINRDSDLDHPFMHVQLDTNGMKLDILLGDGAVPTTPEQGNVIEGHFLLLGMMKQRGGS